MRKKRSMRVVTGCRCEARMGRRSARRGCLSRRVWRSLRKERMLVLGTTEVVRAVLAGLRMCKRLSLGKR